MSTFRRTGWVPTRFPTRYGLAFFGLLALPGCAARYVRVPPRLDLQPYRRIALVTFSADAADSAMSAVATQRFAEAVLASQSGIELLELGTADSSAPAAVASGDGADWAQRLGRDRDVTAVFLGRLEVSSVRPSGRLTGSALAVNATVSAELTVRLLSTRTGGTVWRSSAGATGTVGRMKVSAARPSIAVRDPDRAYDDLVQALVTGVTRDLRPTRVKQ